MTEQQRQAAWEAVHRPEATGEELARIAEAHPEFASAIAAHPNAPATQPAEQAPHEQAERMQQCAQPQYAQPQYAQPHYASDQLSPVQSAQWAKPKVNVAGMIAFSLLVVVTALEFFVPVVMHHAMVRFDIFLLIGFPLLRLILALCAIVIGIVGARMHSRPRFRWMAVGSIVAGSCLAVPLLLSTLSYASPGLLPFYGY